MQQNQDESIICDIIHPENCKQVIQNSDRQGLSPKVEKKSLELEKLAMGRPPVPTQDYITSRLLLIKDFERKSQDQTKSAQQRRKFRAQKYAL